MGWWKIMINWLLWCCRGPAEFSNEPRVATPWLFNKYKLELQREGPTVSQIFDIRIFLFHNKLAISYVLVASFRSSAGQMFRDVADAVDQRTWAFTSASVSSNETSEISDWDKDWRNADQVGALTWSELQSCLLNKNSICINEQWENWLPLISPSVVLGPIRESCFSNIKGIFFTVLAAFALLKNVSLFSVFTLLTDEGDIKTFHSFVNNVLLVYF